MSEVIENYIRRHPGLSEKDAFEGFLQEERIKSWVGADESRKDRLRKEFGRTWGSLHGDTAPSHTARAGPSGPTMQQPRSVRVEAQVRPVDAAPPHAPAEQSPLRPSRRVAPRRRSLARGRRGRGRRAPPAGDVHELQAHRSVARRRP